MQKLIKLVFHLKNDDYRIWKSCLKMILSRPTFYAKFWEGKKNFFVLAICLVWYLYISKEDSIDFKYSYQTAQVLQQLMRMIYCSSQTIFHIEALGISCQILINPDPEQIFVVRHDVFLRNTKHSLFDKIRVRYAIFFQIIFEILNMGKVNSVLWRFCFVGFVYFLLQPRCDSYG